jgi:propionyl-CoA carboxylase beta chain
MVRGTATMGLSGPLLVKAATGEEITKEELGGADVQVDQNGLAHLGADIEEEALEAVKRYLSFLPSNARAATPTGARDDPADRSNAAVTGFSLGTPEGRSYSIRRNRERLRARV